MRQHPKEPFSVRDRKLFCDACRVFVSTKGSTISTHLETKKHELGKQRLKNERARQEGIRTALSRQDALHHPKGEKIAGAVAYFPGESCRNAAERRHCTLQGGTGLRPLLEEHGYRLSGRGHLSDLVPFVFSSEVEALKEELFTGPQNRSRFASVIFDGSTRLGEAIAIIFRFADETWQIRQRLVLIDVVSKSVTGAVLAQVLNECLSLDYRIHGDRLLAAMRDGASVNESALTRLQDFFPQMLGVVCFSHTLDNVGVCSSQQSAHSHKVFM